jgi:tape measure domain-containing protein
MTNIISTGIAIDSSSAVKAKQDMENLASVGAKVDSALGKIEQGSGRTGKSLATLGSYAKEMASSSAQLVTQTQQLNSTQSRQEILLKQIGSSFATLTREIKESTAAAQAQGTALDRNRAGLTGVQQAAAGLGSVMATAFAAKQVYDFADALYQASASAQRIKTTLEFATGNSAKDFAYVTKLADQMGLQFTDTARAFASFAAASKGTSLEGEGARKVFEAVSKAAAVMGLSSEQASGALLALQQMVSKGTVQSEELRGQLGERLPGAFQIAAKAMGVTTAELGKMLEKGEVVASDFLPKFAAALDAYVGGAAEKAANRLDASTNRMGNAFERLKQTAGDSGVASFMAGQYGILTDVMDSVSESMARAKAEGGGFASQMLAGSGAVLDFVNPLNGLSYSAQSAGAKLAEAEGRMKALQERAKAGIDVSVQMGRLQDLIRTLREAKVAADQVAGAPAVGGGRGSVNPETTVQMANRRREAEEERKAYLSDNSRQTKAQIREEEYAKAKTKNAALVARAEGDTNAILKLQAALKVELANIDDKNKDKKPRDTSVRDGKARGAYQRPQERREHPGRTALCEPGHGSRILGAEAAVPDRQRSRAAGCAGQGNRAHAPGDVHGRRQDQQRSQDPRG